MKDEHHSFDDLAEAQNSEDGGSGAPRPRRGGHRGEPRRRRGGFFRTVLPVLLVIAVLASPNGYVGLFVLLLSGPAARLLNRLGRRRPGATDVQRGPKVG